MGKLKLSQVERTRNSYVQVGGDTSWLLLMSKILSSCFTLTEKSCFTLTPFFH